MLSGGNAGAAVMGTLEVLLPAPNQQNNNLPSGKLEIELQEFWRQRLPNQNLSQFVLHQTALARKQGEL